MTRRVTLALVVLGLSLGCGAVPAAANGAADAATDAASGDLVLVVGATGRTGTYAVEQLVDRGYRVRALVRNPDKARAALPAGVDVVVGDVRDPATLDPAMQDVKYVISAIGGGARNAVAGNGPEEVDHLGNVHLVDAALRAGVAQFVLVSSGSVTHAADYPVPFMRPVLAAKLKSEDHLRASGLPYTIARPGALIDEPTGPSRIVLRQGDGPPGRLSRVEVARICVAALGSAAATGKTFEAAAEAGEAAGDLEALFAALQPDPPPAQ